MAACAWPECQYPWLASLQVKNFYMGDTKGESPMYIKVLAGLTTGALAISIASPTDLVKVTISTCCLLQLCCPFF